jgi:hypothetical protein
MIEERFVQTKQVDVLDNKTFPPEYTADELPPQSILLSPPIITELQSLPIGVCVQNSLLLPPIIIEFLLKKLESPLYLLTLESSLCIITGPVIDL